MDLGESGSLGLFGPPQPSKPARGLTSTCLLSHDSGSQESKVRCSVSGEGLLPGLQMASRCVLTWPFFCVSGEKGERRDISGVSRSSDQATVPVRAPPS